MASANVGDGPASPPRLPRWRSSAVPRSYGRTKLDWGLIVPIPASIAANREVLFSQFGEMVPLVHCLHSRVIAGRRTADAVIAVAEELYTDVKALLAANAVSVAVEPVGGEGSREQCLSAGLAAARPASQYVLVHDIHRPLASASISSTGFSMDCDSGNDVIVPALAMVDSVKTVDSSGAVTETVDRSRLRSAQYPRGFHASSSRRFSLGRRTRRLRRTGSGAPQRLARHDRRG